MAQGVPRSMRPPPPSPALPIPCCDWPYMMGYRFPKGEPPPCPFGLQHRVSMRRPSPLRDEALRMRGASSTGPSNASGAAAYWSTTAALQTRSAKHVDESLIGRHLRSSRSFQGSWTDGGASPTADSGQCQSKDKPGASAWPAMLIYSVAGRFRGAPRCELLGMRGRARHGRC